MKFSHYNYFNSMIQDQLRQIKAGGLRTLGRKLKKAGWHLLLRLTAPAIVCLGIDWPKAYDFLASRIFRKTKKLRIQPDLNNKELIDRLVEQSIICLKKNTTRKHDLAGLPDWARGQFLLGNLYRLNNELKKSLDLYKIVDEGRRQVFQKHGLDDLGIEFIPRALPVGSMGVYEYLEMNIKARILDACPQKKMILLLPPGATVNNLCYLKYWRKYLAIVSDPALIERLAPLEALFTNPVVEMTYFREKLYWSCLAQGLVREQWIQEARPPFFTLSQEDKEKGWNCLRSLGLSKDAWFVTLHVREPGWRDDHSREENFRNANIESYFPAIKTITDAGGWVVRIGDPGMSQLPEMPNVIDYAHSQAKSDWMDIFLCAQCRFFIGTSSGMCVVASSFGVPLAMTNLLPGYGVYHFTSRDLFIPRLCFSEEKGRYLSFQELLSPPVSTATIQSHFDKAKVRIVANEAEEIKALVEEMLEKAAGSLRYREEDEALQKNFRAITSNCGKLYGDLNLVSHGCIGREFLRRHADLLTGIKDVKKENSLMEVIT